MKHNAIMTAGDYIPESLSFPGEAESIQNSSLFHCFSNFPSCLSKEL